MKWLRDIKFGILFGVIGFTLTIFSMYLATGIFDWRFPAVIGTGFFGGGVLGSFMRRWYKSGEERKANLIFSFLLIFLLISNVYDLITGEIKVWKVVNVFACIFLLLYFLVLPIRRYRK